MFFFFSSRRRHTRCSRDWSSDVCSSDLTSGVRPAWRAASLYMSASSVAFSKLVLGVPTKPSASRPARRAAAGTLAPNQSGGPGGWEGRERENTRLNSSHRHNSYCAVFLEKKKKDDAKHQR